MYKYALMMELPEGKLPGFYAQIVKSLANRVSLFDREKELLIVSNTSDRDAAVEVLVHYRIPFEILDLLLLPEDIRLSTRFDDYGFTSRAGNQYLYANEVVEFTLTEESTPDSEKQQALFQIEEHLLGSYSQNSELIYIISKQDDELLIRTAQAYGCRIQFLKRRNDE